MKKKNVLSSAVLLAPFWVFAEGPVGAKGPAGQLSIPPLHVLTTTETWITFLPGIFFLIILLLTTIKLRNSRVKISDILAEKDKNGAAVANLTATDPPADPQQPSVPPVQSASRYVVFLTGLVALTIGICLTMFFIYTYFSKDKLVDLSYLNTVIWGLGIGVIPYGANKVSVALKP